MEGDCQTLQYSYYEKPTSSPYVTLENSAWAWSPKHSSLAQNMVRRMSNTTERLDQGTWDEIINKFAAKLRTSGYSRNQAREIITSGLKGYKNRRRREMEGGTPIQRMKHKTQKSRDLRKMMTKNNWFKTKSTHEGVPHQARGTGGHGGDGRVGRHTQPSSTRPTSVTVIFVPRTPEGKLIQNLRVIEQKLGTVNHKTIRVVEEAGQKLVEVLCKGDPWEKVHCGKVGCTTCAPSWGKLGTCRTKNTHA